MELTHPMSGPLQILIAFASVPAGLYAIHRLMLFCEAKDWIYYKRKRPEASSRSGGVLTQFQQFVEPEVRHVEEYKAEQKEIRLDDRPRRSNEGDGPPAEHP